MTFRAGEGGMKGGGRHERWEEKISLVSLIGCSVMQYKLKPINPPDSIRMILVTLLLTTLSILTT